MLHCLAFQNTDYSYSVKSSTSIDRYLLIVFSYQEEGYECYKRFNNKNMPSLYFAGQWIHRGFIPDKE
ncbi:Uncharacterised protein [Serratia plymuthica]|nr:Uncharacterised protein [Serratia plymuthica]VEI17984.1 Uncharacterised protein [Serratia plymuthica]